MDEAECAKQKASHTRFAKRKPSINLANCRYDLRAHTYRSLTPFFRELVFLSHFTLDV